MTHEEVKAEQFYASYCIGLFFDDKEFTFQPCDFRYVGLHRTAGYILGVDPTEVPPKLALSDASRPIPEPYVCIAVQSTTQSKYWNNPEGWRAIVKMLKEAGMTILLVEQNARAALALADHAYVLETGSVTLEGPGPELLENDDVRRAYLGM